MSRRCSAVTGGSPRWAHAVGSRGLTLVELIIVTALIATLASIALPIYADVTERARIIRAIAEIRVLESEIAVFEMSNGRLPADLGEIGRGTLKDSWGNPYEYLNFSTLGPKGKGKVRKDRNLVPLNSTYDLYSEGKDGESQSALTAKASQDDIIRANDGGYIGLASAY
ncbi:MAG: hypothetical protein A3E31_05380 [Candidatus Rokubacteria bacterium RIFCSPHIGHO2_12_FULL_73_22]|nr:MAG: hypothetical protein A3D33_04255 [Candidatus Rokubacteria bacterium RIFCSPHIGHO2_02_FULL_73_26]OGK98520.1 MAG: hypothetical protein A3E31_05380 [Candidatus Rokubacteria bacterium RIFCSPHIGHO2_12_FULL_73_22]OGL11729.1 MAG: hypothetical protein A3I14_00575 [Candidatus Rokubacteria bacterium RIFCSPLOWO2_02_FULL_73_56]OGL26399.1 MAG: hypothetical protein A3G44_03285 [Candidatus Rokubacteria bacterium RIFCSPLOWO2_12_FULL_73_47]